MLIRSQNKKNLIDMSNLIIGLDKSDTKVICFHTAAMDGEASAILGEYSTTEKAVRAISMIQQAYTYAEVTKMTIPEIGKTFKEAPNTKENELLEEAIKVIMNNLVFQMPRDSEV
jgi:hypothetical protein